MDPKHLFYHTSDTGITVRQVPAKSSLEVTTYTSSNIVVWLGTGASEKDVRAAGLTESLISSLFAIAKGLVKYERPNSWT